MAKLGIEWLGQSGFLLRFPTGATVCIDPYLSYAASGGKTRERLLPIPVPASQIAADIVVTTHDHVDHFDEHSLRPIAERRETIFVGPASCRDHWLAMGLPAERFLRLDWGESVGVAGVELRAVYARHSSGDRQDAIGIVLEAGGVRVYHVGDSEYTPPLLERVEGLAPDLLAVPINGRGGNMGSREAASLTGVVGPRVVIPMHYGMFGTNTADPQDFVDACRAAAIEARIAIVTAGRPFELDLSAEPQPPTGSGRG